MLYFYLLCIYLITSGLFDHILLCKTPPIRVHLYEIPILNCFLYHIEIIFTDTHFIFNLRFIFYSFIYLSNPSSLSLFTYPSHSPSFSFFVGVTSLVLHPDKLKTQVLSMSLSPSSRTDPSSLKMHSTSTHKVE